jgi:hypothetical protein
MVGGDCDRSASVVEIAAWCLFAETAPFGHGSHTSLSERNPGFGHSMIGAERLPSRDQREREILDELPLPK